MALSFSDLPFDELFDIVGGSAVKKLDLAFFGEDEEDVPLPPILRFTVQYKGQRVELYVLADALQIINRRVHRAYNIVGLLTRRNAEGEWCSMMCRVEVCGYSPKAGNASNDKGMLRIRNSGVLQPIFWV